MKQKAKSLLALVLALSLCLSMVCVPASASDTDNIAVADGATVTIAEEAEDGADDDESAEADTSADEAEPEADASADEPAEEEAEADAPVDEPAADAPEDEPAEESTADAPTDEADVPVAAAEGEDEEMADDTIVLTSEGGTLSSGNYILEADVVLETKLTINSGVEVTLDLNGRTLSVDTSSTTLTSVVYVNGGSFTLKDSSEDGTGVLTSGAAGTKVGSSAGAYYGAGLYVKSGTFTLESGTISGIGKETKAGNGAAVYVGNSSSTSNPATFIMNGGTITDNHSTYSSSSCGGGVYLYGSGTTFYMYGGTISNNSATGSGGGIYMNSATVYMTGGTITGNYVTSTSSSYGFGGGIYASNNKQVKIYLSGGSITSNTATNAGGGIYVCSSSSVTPVVSLSGDIVVTGNTVDGAESNIYLKTANQYLTLGELTEGASIGVTTASAPTEGSTVQLTTAETETSYYASSAGYFSSDAGYYVAADAENGYLVLTTEAPEPDVDYAAQNVTTSTSYETLQEAIDAASSGDEVALLMDATEEVTVASDDVITLDLAGYTLTGTGDASVVTVNGDLTLKDSSEDGTGSITGGSATYGGGVYVAASASFTLTSGTITGNNARYGGGIYADENAVLTMNGGAISENTASSTDSVVRGGGGVYLNTGSIFTMNDGKITGNTSDYHGGGVFASKATFTMNDGEISGNTAKTNGGGVYLYSSCTFTMADGKITGNSVTGYPSYGGGICTNTGANTVTISGGEISGNTSAYNGGGVYISSATFTMTGGAITGNTSAKSGGGVNLYTSTTATLTGGSITDNTAGTNGGGIYAASSAAITVSGTPVITGNTAGEEEEITVNNIYLSGKTTYLTLGELTEGASIGVTTKNAPTVDAPVQFTTTETETTYYTTSAGYFTSDAGYVVQANEAGYLELGPVTYAAENVTTETYYTTLQDAIDEASSGDEVALLMDVTEDVTVATDDVITLDLAGYTLTGTGETSVVTVNGDLTLKDSSEDGTGTVTGGVGTVYQSSYTYTLTVGGGVYVCENASFTMNGGTITGNTATCGGGVGITDGATFVMTDGNITGNSNDSTSSSRGGGVGVRLTSSDATATVTITGGKISDNTSQYGGGIGCNEGSLTLILSGATITGNTASVSAGGVYISGSGNVTLTMSDSEISDNTISTGNGGGIYCSNANAAISLESGAISNNTATGTTTSGGGVYVRIGTFTMSGGEITGNTAGSGGGVNVNDGASFTMSGGTISGNTATSTSTYGGGGVLLYATSSTYPSSTFTMTGGEITGNTAVKYGGGISSYSGTNTFTMSGGTVANNTAGTAGDDIYASKSSTKPATLILSTISSGTLTDCGHDIDGWYNDTSSSRWSGTSYKAVDTSETLTSASAVIALKAAHGEIIYVAENVTTETYYTTLQDAIDAAGEGDEVALLMDVTEDVTVASDDVITLDLAGYTLTGTGDASVITVNGSLTLEDSSEDGTGMLLSSSRGTKYAAGQYFGAGVYVYSGTFTLESGTISGLTNTASAGNGAGVYVGNTSGISATFIMNGGTISDNHAQYSTGSGGGGVYVRGSETTFYMNGGTICNNSATGVGGGVYISSATFIMTGGTITGNAATGTSSASGNGGGIATAISDTTKIELSGGTITGNTAVNNGGGIFANSSSSKASTVSVSGDIVITGNTAGDVENNVYLKTANQCLTLGELTEGASIGVTTASAPTEDATVQFTTTETETSYYASSAAYFTSDAGYVVQANAAGYLELGTVTYAAENVTTTTYYTTLQDAIDAASSGDEIALLMDVTEDVTVASDDVITLDLAGYTLTGSGTTSVITVKGNLTLEDSSEAGTGTITGGSATYGGGVYVGEGASLTLTSGSITGNSARYGGGVSIDTSAAFTMSGGTISENAASGSSTNERGGGGVYLSSSSTFVMNDGKITANTSDFSGGGVYVNDKSTFTMNGGEISGNTCKGTKTNAYGGGGVFVRSISADSDNSAFTMNGGSITDNTSSKYGGGVSICGTDKTYCASFTMTGGTISGNTGTYGGGVSSYQGVVTMELTGGTITDNTASSYGGGVYSSINATLTMADCKVTDNEATSGGGLMLYGSTALTNCVITGNSSTKYGGGGLRSAYTDGAITLTGCVIIGNLASGSYSYGGGVYITGSLVMTECQVTGNTSSGSAGYGGGLYIAAKGSASISGGTFANNTAETAGDDIYATGSTANPAALTLDVTLSGTLADCGHEIDGWYSDASDSRWSEANATAVDTSETLTSADTAIALKAAHAAIVYVAENVTTSTTYTTLQDAIDAASSGDEIALLMDVTEDVTVASDDVITLDLTGYTLTGSGTTSVITVKGNLTLEDSSEAGTGTVTGGSAKYGGGVYVGEGASFTLASGTITGNTATNSGGGVYLTDATFTMTGGTITGNTATNSGGGVYLTDATFTMTGGTISGNTGTSYGGGVCASGGTIEITGGKVSDNTAKYGGGVRGNLNTTMTISDCEISGNTGGGVFTVGSLTMTGCTVSNNTASGMGGGVRSGAALTLTNCVITGNIASGYSGGGVYAGASLTMTGCTVSGNTGTNGGGVYASADLTMSGCTVSGNTGTNGGGLYLNSGSTATVSDSSIDNNTASTAGDDIYAKASSAKPVSLTLSTPSGTLTACGHDINGWYDDSEGARWSETNSTTVDTSEPLTATSAVALKAAHSAEFAIITDPADVTAEKGTSATFTVVATGTDLTYQWQYQTATGSKWYNCTSATGEGYASDSVTLTANAGRNGYKYRCVVTNGDGETLTSEQAVLTVTTPVTVDAITITAQPESVTAAKGDSVTLTVEATSNLGETLTYQWQYQTATGSKWYNCTATTGEGYASDSITLTANSGRNGYKYRCKITNESGNVVYADVITLTVTTE